MCLPELLIPIWDASIPGSGGLPEVAIGSRLLVLLRTDGRAGTAHGGASGQLRPSILPPRLCWVSEAMRLLQSCTGLSGAGHAEPR